MMMATMVLLLFYFVHCTPVRSRRYPAEKISDAYFADDIVHDLSDNLDEPPKMLTRLGQALNPRHSTCPKT